MIDFVPVVPFAGLALPAIAFVYASVCFGFFVRGAFGFGSNMPIVLLTTWVLGPHHTVILVAVMATLAQIHLLPQGPRHADWKVVAMLLPGTAAGIAVATVALTRLQASGLMTIMGALVLAIVVMDRLRIIERLSSLIDLRAPTISSALAVTSGALGTLSGGGGIYFLAGYLKHACPEPTVFRCTNIVVSGVFMGVRFVSLAVAGLIAFEYIVEALALLPAIFLGTWTGGRMFRASSTAGFYRALQLLMLVAALALVGRGLTDLI